MTYSFVFTPLGKAFAETRSTPKAIEEEALKEILTVCPEGETFNGMASFTVGDQLFIAASSGDGLIFIDTATMEEGPMLDAGPFKGKRMMMPRGDTEER